MLQGIWNIWYPLYKPQIWRYFKNNRLNSVNDDQNSENTADFGQIYM